MIKSIAKYRARIEQSIFQEKSGVITLYRASKAVSSSNKSEWHFFSIQYFRTDSC